MSKTNAKIQRVELDCFQSPVHCPVCGQQVLSGGEEEIAEITPCRHTLFVAHDEGFEHRSPAFDKAKGIEGIDSDDLDLDGGIDAFTDDVEIDNSIKFATYIPAPSFFGAYVGFKFD